MKAIRRQQQELRWRINNPSKTSEDNSEFQYGMLQALHNIEELMTHPHKK